MEFPLLGESCANSECKRFDFLPLKCDACQKLFCQEHFSYESHHCPGAYKKDVQVPVCPLCGVPVPVGRSELPDAVVGAHIDRDCQSDPAKNRRKVFANKCAMKGCRGKEVVPMLCRECTQNFCLKHRHPADHQCVGHIQAARAKAAGAAVARMKATSNNQQPSNMRNGTVQRKTISPPSVSAVQGFMSEDEALARALALSLEDSDKSSRSSQQQRNGNSLSERCAVS